MFIKYCAENGVAGYLIPTFLTGGIVRLLIEYIVRTSIICSRYLTFLLLRSRHPSGQAQKGNKRKGPCDYAQDWPKAPLAKE